MFRNCPRTSQTMRSLSCSHVDFQSNLIKWPAVLFFFQALYSKIIRIFFVFPGVHRYLIVYLHLKTKLMPTVTESPWSIKKNTTLVSDWSSVGERILWEKKRKGFFTAIKMLDVIVHNWYNMSFLDCMLINNLYRFLFAKTQKRVPFFLPIVISEGVENRFSLGFRQCVSDSRHVTKDSVEFTWAVLLILW